MKDLDLQELPPLVYQLLLLSTKVQCMLSFLIGKKLFHTPASINGSKVGAALNFLIGKSVWGLPL